MPEQITKHPEVTLKVLEGAGARCGTGEPQRILTRCPPERFCALPSGEICVYGIDQIPMMTQITPQELARVVCPPEHPASLTAPNPAGLDWLALGAACAVGMLVGRAWRGPIGLSRSLRRGARRAPSG
jgi:hypothetical protein